MLHCLVSGRRVRPKGTRDSQVGCHSHERQTRRVYLGGVPDDDLVPELAAATVNSLPGGAFLSILFDRSTRAVRREWERNLSTALRVAEARSGLSREDLQERLEESPQLVPLYVRVLYAAGMTGHDRTLKLLGGFLGEAFADTSQVDDVSLILSSVESLTEHHIKALEIIASPLSSSEIGAASKATKWSTGLVAQVSGMRPSLAHAACRGLLNAGLASDDAGGTTLGNLLQGGTVLEPTDLGRTVLEVLNAVAKESR
jgi:hypothetical protein